MRMQRISTLITQQLNFTAEAKIVISKVIMILIVIMIMIAFIDCMPILFNSCVMPFSSFDAGRFSSLLVC